MNAKLLVGKFYRRENGSLVEYKAGDVISAAPAEIARLRVDKGVPDNTGRMRRKAKVAPAITEPEITPEELEKVIPKELTDDELLEKHIESRSGAWYIMANGKKVQGRLAALSIAKDMEADG